MARGFDRLPQPAAFYAWPHAETSWPPARRLLDVEATHTLALAAADHPAAHCYRRSVEAYRRALECAIPETELMCGEFLYITAETLSRAIVEGDAARQGITPKNLARLRNVSSPSALYRQERENTIFGAHPGCLSALEQASNGFEHGYMTFDDARAMFATRMETAARAVRHALIREARLAPTIEGRLLDPKFDEMLPLMEPEHFMQGELVSIDPARPVGTGSVELTMTPHAVKATRTTDGLSIETALGGAATALPDNMRFEPKRIGVRAVGLKSLDEVSMIVNPVDEAASEAGRPMPDTPADHR